MVLKSNRSASNESKKNPPQIARGACSPESRLELEAVLDAERLTVGDATDRSVREAEVRQREDAVVEVQAVVAELEVQTAEVGADVGEVSVSSGETATCPRVIADWAGKCRTAALTITVLIRAAGKGDLENAWRAEDARVERQAGAEPTGARGVRAG